MPAAVAASLTDCVLAARPPLSDPTWENPRVICLLPVSEPVDLAGFFFAHAASIPAAETAAPAVRKLRLSIMSSPSRNSAGLPVQVADAPLRSRTAEPPEREQGVVSRWWGFG